MARSSVPVMRIHGDAIRFGTLFQPRKLRHVAIDDRRTARRDTEKDFSFRIGDSIDGLKKFQMH